MKFNLNNKTLTVFLSGHIESDNSSVTEKEIKEIINNNPADSIIFDATDLQYISSAGLRIILRLLHSELSLKIINVSSELYEIFEMTGFTEIMSVEKAFRSVSIDGCEVIGQGANGKVYRLDPDTIIKVYFNPDSLPDINRERELARKAFILGIPTAIPYDVVKVGEGYGSVFEMLNAKSFAAILKENPDNIDACVYDSVELLKKIHSTELKSGEMPSAKEKALGWVDFLTDYLPEDVYIKLRYLVENVPETNHMLHGDFHVKNIMQQNGETLLIDMDTLCLGHPVFEFASVYLAYQGFGELDHENILQFLGIPYDLAGEFWRKTLRLYFDTEDEEFCRIIEDKARTVGYARLMRQFIRRNGLETSYGRAVIENCKEQLKDLISRIDSLDF